MGRLAIHPPQDTLLKVSILFTPPWKIYGAQYIYRVVLPELYFPFFFFFFLIPVRFGVSALAYLQEGRKVCPSQNIYILTLKKYRRTLNAKILAKILELRKMVA
jgi:hypothetical protein